ncbi:3-isopropylmalate dehydratase small subunit [Candidatus Formimonas warabiya]|uniref:3-isopropylmalate dehydratase small subunit n=1 Tax=Formimonas warabiya TaxID=1761012 RepID=UPI0011D04AAD|nr:3-isopropylmalate dehydratase small subunit [Candidatus Formimonas warabiya]
MSKIIEGKVWKLGDSIDTDVILPGAYLSLTKPEELAVHALEGLEEGFAQRFGAGDILVGGRNFGCGSSREQAPVALKYAGISVVVAESFARIFYRNALNIGLPLLECQGIAGFAQEGDTLAVDIAQGEIRNEAKGILLIAKPIPEFLMEIIKDGGLVSNLKKQFQGR